VAVHIELFAKAKHDLHRIGPGPDRKAIIDAVTVGLTAIPPPENLNVKALKGAAPWLRLRVGDYRILYRPLTPFEVKTLQDQREIAKQVREHGDPEMLIAYLRGRRQGRGPRQYPEAGFLVARIVHRRDLDRAVRTLPL
jgi:mRNA-degrading endonuclease RelE of RelBE toxin-antitoxin system